MVSLLILVSLSSIGFVPAPLGGHRGVGRDGGDRDAPSITIARFAPLALYGRTIQVSDGLASSRACTPVGMLLAAVAALPPALLGALGLVVLDRARLTKH